MVKREKGDSRPSIGYEWKPMRERKMNELVQAYRDKDVGAVERITKWFKKMGYK